MSLSHPMLAAYWIPYVGIGQNPTVDVVVPLTDMLNYTLADGTPQTKIVFLGAAAFCCTVANFVPPYVSINSGLMQQLTLQPGQTKTAVQQLQAAGIKVLLSIMGPNDPKINFGWDNVPYARGANRFANMEAFAQWVRSELIDRYGLDGIDIDDEYGGPTDVQAFVDTIAILRQSMQGKLLTKALWKDAFGDFDYFGTPVSADAPYSAGAKLASLLDLGCTMAYGIDLQSQIDNIGSYNSVGMTWDKLCVGVQAGPYQLGWMTDIGETAQLAAWAVTPQSGQTNPPVLGMMLYTFPQDIQQWDQWPQNSPQYTWPNPGDHAWQQAIVIGMWGASNWKVAGG
jgi:Glycosyl hydrolases family 18